MTITFNIRYETKYGEELYICGIGEDIKMEYSEDGYWTKSIILSSSKERVVSYRYCVKERGRIVAIEIGEERELHLGKDVKRLICNDLWLGNDDKAPFYTSPFTKVFYKQSDAQPTIIQGRTETLVIKTSAPLTKEETKVVLCGEGELLGNWDVNKGVLMTPNTGCHYQAQFNLADLKSDMVYKFAKIMANGEVVWEFGKNRVLEIPKLKSDTSIIVENFAGRFELTNPRFLGTAIPVFSLRSHKSAGVGDFADIKLLVDWVKQCGQNFIQLLPINDTTTTHSWSDSYPYSGISVMALHPLYLSIEEAGELKKRDKMAQYRAEADALNKEEFVNYDKVINLKERFSRDLYNDIGVDVLTQADYLSFFKNNSNWLIPYAAFCILRDRNKSADFTTWGDYAVFNASAIEAMSKKERKEFEYYYFVQFLLHKQLLDARNYAHENGVAIKGDIPIGITRNSVEAWCEPQYFNMGQQAGAPPDFFSANGQNWGFPTYNWDVIAQDGYNWWRKRLKKMSEYFDAYRIDHVLGFFRIWQVPITETIGTMGKFYPAIPLSSEEISSRGMSFDEERYCKPYIREYMLREMFGDKFDYICNTFLESTFSDHYKLKAEFSTQRAILNSLETQQNNIIDKDDIQSLLSLVAEVLFLEDDQQRGCYHPRINVHGTYTYKSLPQDLRSAYDAIYEDYFFHRNENMWRDLAYQKLPAIMSASHMLACAEDLGMVPNCVDEVLRNLRVLTLEVQRMPKTFGLGYSDPAWHRYLSVCTTGSHDISTIRGWWEEDHNLSQRFYNEFLGFEGEAPAKMEPWIAEQIIKRHVHSSSMLTILPLQDWLATAASMYSVPISHERINEPANPRHYWKYRMHIALEDLLTKRAFNNYLKKMREN